MRTIHGHSGGAKVDTALLDTVVFLKKWSEYFYDIGCSRFLHTITQSRFVCRRKRFLKRKTNTILHPQEEYPDLSKPQKVHHKSKWKIQDAKNWTNLRQVQDKRFKFWQTRSQAMILHDSVPANCIERAKTQEILDQKASTPRPPLEIVLSEAWQVQFDGSCQHGTGIGKLAADEDKKEFKIDLRAQGIPQKAVYQDEE